MDNNMLAKNISTTESRTKLLNNIRKEDSIELYKDMYEDYKQQSELLDYRSSFKNFYKDTFTNGFLGGTCGLTLAVGSVKNINMFGIVISSLIGFSIGSMSVVCKNGYDSIKIGKLQKQLVDIAVELKILEDIKGHYYVYVDEASIDEEAKNSCIQTDPALGAAYKIACKR